MSNFEYRKCDKCGGSSRRYGSEDCKYCEVKDCEDQDWPRCPKCFRAEEEWHEDFARSNDGDEVKMECGNCETDYVARIQVSYTFDSTEIKEKDG